MKRVASLVAVVALLACNKPTPAEELPTTPRQLQIDLRLFKGDPNGSREAGTIKLLQEPRLVTIENWPATFVAGGLLCGPDMKPQEAEFVDFGSYLTVKANLLPADKAQLEITTVTPERGEPIGKLNRMRTSITRMVTVVENGKVNIFPFGTATGAKRLWVEMTVYDVERTPSLPCPPPRPPLRLNLDLLPLSEDRHNYQGVMRLGGQ